MLRGLFSVESGEAILPFVRQFHGVPSTYLWQDDSRNIHEIHQGEGGEQGDALMPTLFCQHNALAAVQQELGTFHDDIYVTCSPSRIVPIFVESYGCTRASKSIWGKPKFGTGEEVSPQDGRSWPQMPKRVIPMQLCGGATAHSLWRIKGCSSLAHLSAVQDSWKGSWGKWHQKQQVLLDRIPHVSNLQCAWLLLLCCASLRPNYFEDVAPLCNSRVRDPP